MSKSVSENKSTKEKIFESAYIGTAPVLITFGLTHPLDLIKTRLQSNPELKNGVKVSIEVYKSSNGLKGFYTGGSINFSRAALKEAYRNPVRGMIKSLYSDLIPHSLSSRSAELKNIATGFTMASFDMIILCPLERLKVWLMTNYSKDKSLIRFLKENNGSIELLKNLFRGFKVSYIRSIISWTSYLVIEERVRKTIILKFNLNSEEAETLWFQILNGTVSGLINSGITLPFDSVKTQIQKSNALKQQLIFQTMKRIFNEHGIQGLYAGWKYRVPAYVIVGVVTAGNIQRIDKIWNVR